LKRVSRTLGEELSKLIDRSAKLSATNITEAVQAQSRGGAAGEAQIIAAASQQGIPLVCVVEVNAPNIEVRLLDVRTKATLVRLNAGGGSTDLRNPAAVAQLVRSVLDLSKEMVSKAEEAAAAAPPEAQRQQGAAIGVAAPAPPSAPQPPPQQQAVRYTLAANRLPEAGGIVTPTNQADIAAGTQINITAAAAEGYAFVNWTAVPEEGSQIANANSAATTITMNANTIVTANFRLVYSLTVSRAQETGGTVNSIPPKLTAGIPVRITATPASGYDFVDWTVESGEAHFADKNSASTAVAISSDAKIIANFRKQIYTLTVNATPAEGGAVSPAAVKDSIFWGTQIEVKAAAAEGYRFVNWSLVSGRGSQIADARATTATVTVNAATTVTANFQPIYTLTAHRDPQTGGTVTPAIQSGITAGTPVDISARAATGYIFVNWAVLGGDARLANANSEKTTITMRSNAVVAANFYGGPLHTLTVNQAPMNGGSASARRRDNIIPGTPIEITASAADGHTFVSWRVTSGNAQLTNANNPNTTVIVDSDATVTADFQPIFSLKVNRYPNAGGSVAATAQSGITAGTPVEITASQTSGHRFVNWRVTSGQAWFADMNNPRTTVVLGSDAAVIAYFEQTLSLTVNVNLAAGGSAASGAQTNIIAGTPVGIMATEKAGHEFVNWTISGGQAWFADANDPNTTVILGSNATITANFKRSASTKMPAILATFGIGWQSTNYDRVSDQNIRDPDRTVANGPTLGTNIMFIRRSGFTISAGADFIINMEEGVNIDPVLGMGYVRYREYYVGGILNLIAKPYILYDYVNADNYQHGGIFIAPTLLMGYDLGIASLGGQFSVIHNPASSTTGFKFSVIVGGVGTRR
jgi:hypothetical protein